VKKTMTRHFPRLGLRQNKPAAVLEENTFADNAANSSERQGPLQFTFESDVDRIFSSPRDRLCQLFSSHHTSAFSSKKKKRVLCLV
jgi:hypothetical protein